MDTHAIINTLLGALLVGGLGWLQARAKAHTATQKATDEKIAGQDKDVAVMKRDIKGLAEDITRRRDDFKSHEDLHDQGIEGLRRIEHRLSTIEADVKHIIRDVDDTKRSRREVTA